jgi:hypothetical protein
MHTPFTSTYCSVALVATVEVRHDNLAMAQKTCLSVDDSEPVAFASPCRVTESLLPVAQIIPGAQLGQALAQPPCNIVHTNLKSADLRLTFD